MTGQDPRRKKLMEILLTYYRNGDGRDTKIRSAVVDKIMAVFVEEE